MELLHGLDAVGVQKIEQGGALLQCPDFSGTGVRPLELLLGLPQVDYAGLLALRLLGLGLRPVVETGIMEMKDFSPLMMQAFRGTEATIAQGFGGKADYSNPDFRMMIMSGADAPLRAAVLSSGGSFPAAAAQGLLAAANGQTDGPA